MRILNEDSYDNMIVRTQAGTTFLNPELAEADLVGRYPGALGNSIQVSVCLNKDQYSKELPGVFNFVYTGSTQRSNTAEYVAPNNATLVDVTENVVKIGDKIRAGFSENVVIGIDVTSPTTAIFTFEKIYRGTEKTDVICTRLWRYNTLFTTAPTYSLTSPENNTFYVVVYDKDGKITGTVGTILEAYELSKTPDKRNQMTGLSDYYVDVIRNRSKWIYFGGAFDYDAYSLEENSIEFYFSDGSNNQGGVAFPDPETHDVGLDDYVDGYDLFRNPEEVTVGLIIAGDAIRADWGAVLVNYIAQNICEVRKDCVLFVSPPAYAVLSSEAVIGSVDDSSAKLDNILSAMSEVVSSSFIIADNNWKLVYDKYNDTYVWIPCNADHAGAYARVDNEQEGWVSAGGVTKGAIKNVVKLAWSPNETERDFLYKNGINPITNLPSYGPTIYGDKTLLRNDGSAFSRINVRRLFIILRNSIVKSAQNLLFEFNDEFTRRRFDSIVRPFLVDVKNKNGIEDFLIVADASVNTAQVIQSNQFIGKILIKPKYSINFIRLDFVAVGQSVSFEEALGA